MNKIIVTGGAGFLGSNLCKKLLEDPNNKVYCLDNLYTGAYGNIAELLEMHKDRFIFHKFDIVDNRIEDYIKEQIDEIYNLACPASPPWYQKDPVKTAKTSTIGIWNILDYIVTYNKYCKILQTSTSEVYGNPLVHPQKEDYCGNVNPIGIRSCYDEGKRLGETILMDYHKMHGVKIKIVRIFNTYGPNMDPSDGRIVSNFICQALENKPMTVYGDGTQTRSCCYVDDMVRGLMLLMHSDNNIIGPINIGNPDERSVLEIGNLIKSRLNSSSEIVYKPLPSDDPIKRKPDISKAKDLLGWEPVIPLEVGIDYTITYFKHIWKKR